MSALITTTSLAVGAGLTVFVFVDPGRQAAATRVLRELVGLGERLLRVLDGSGGQASPERRDAREVRREARSRPGPRYQTAVVARLVADGGPLAPCFLPDKKWTAGRTDEADVVVDDALVSAVHCRFEETGRGWQVTDLNSTNGTYLNGRRVTRAILRDGDRIGFGDPGPEVTFRTG